MALLNLPAPFAEIDATIEGDDLDGRTRRATERSRKQRPISALVELLEIKIALRVGSLAPQLAMNRLLALMRQDSKLPGSHELYKEASQVSYDGGTSSLSHSHPPPPIKMK